jgi:UTP--glucose-1-phosphate uridylyltransferase
MAKIRTCVFPVAGLGTRFLPATKSIPKEMLVVVDKPLIQYAVEEAITAGIERFIFITSMGKSAIEDHFDAMPILEQTLQGRGKARELALIQNTCLNPGQAIYVRQQRPLGLGHAIYCAKELIEDDAFAVILADDLVQHTTPCLKQMIDAYSTEDGNMVGVMDVAPADVNRYGILAVSADTGAKVTAHDVVEKPTPEKAPSRTAIIGRYVLQRGIFDKLANQNQGTGGEIQITDAIQAMMPHTPLTGYRFAGTRYDCGTKFGWLEANLAFALDDPELQAHLEKIYGQRTK